MQEIIWAKDCLTLFSWSCEFESHLGGVYSIQHYVIKLISELGQVSGLLRIFQIPPPNKTNRHDITEILLKVALITLNKTKPHYCQFIAQYIWFSAYSLVFNFW